MKKEIWKDIIGYDGHYQVSKSGLVRSLTRQCKTTDGNEWLVREGQLLKPWIRNRYYCVALSCNGNSKSFVVHRLVAIAFKRNPKNLPCINHKDCDKFNNNASNLKWCTHAQNMKHAADNGRYIRGIDRHNSKLKERDILEIRRSKMTRRQLANKFNVCYTTIVSILTRKKWKHI